MTATYLGSNGKLEDVSRLIDNMKTIDVAESNQFCDTCICMAIKASANFFKKKTIPSKTKQLIENIMNQITDPKIRVQTLFKHGYLKSAYLLAVQIKDDEYLKKIYEKAKAEKNDYIVKLCEKRIVKSNE